VALLTDTHCHLNLNQFAEDLELVLERAVQNGVDRILVPGIDLETSQRAIDIAEKYTGVFAAVGVHPNNANSWNSGTIKEIEALSQHPKVVAIGEIGLDYYRCYAAREVQKVVFEVQLDLASRRQLPVLIHNREATHDLWRMLKGWRAQLQDLGKDLAKRPGVLHAFEESMDIASEAIQLNFYLGFGGAITYPKAGNRVELIRKLPLEGLLVETDAPYLSPQSQRGQRNEPANVRIITKKIAEIKNLNYDKVVKATSQNAERIFLWSASR